MLHEAGRTDRVAALVAWARLERPDLQTAEPVVNLAGDAGRWLAAVQELLRALDPRKRARMLGGNARRIYGL